MSEVDTRYRPHGDEWRWRLAAGRSIPTISVIVTSPTADEPPGRTRVFGFSRVLHLQEVEPLLWEGD